MDDATTEKNGEHLWKELHARARSEVPAERAEEATHELLRRSVSSVENLETSKLTRGDLLSFELEVSGENVLEFGGWKNRPTPEGLLLLLSQYCKDGYKIKATTRFYGGSSVAEAHWPISLETAEKMTADVRFNPIFERRVEKESSSVFQVGKRRLDVKKFQGSKRQIPQVKIDKEHKRLVLTLGKSVLHLSFRRP